MPPVSPLGPAPVTERPQGLLDLLGIKNGGQYPQHLASDWLLPIFDLGNWYQQWQQELQVFPTTALGNIASLQTVTTVPTGELWLVHDLALRSSAAIAATMTAFGLEVWGSDSTGAALSQLAVTEPLTTTAAGTSRVAFMQQYPEPRLILPGTPIWMGAWLFTGTGAPAVNVHLRFTRCGL